MSEDTGITEVRQNSEAGLVRNHQIHKAGEKEEISSYQIAQRKQSGATSRYQK